MVWLVFKERILLPLRQATHSKQRKAHKRYDQIKHQKCSSNPLSFTQGGLYQGYKDPDDEVGDLIRYMTSSFGITALDEARYL